MLASVPIRARARRREAAAGEGRVHLQEVNYLRVSILLSGMLWRHAMLRAMEERGERKEGGGNQLAIN